jgi:hypothetical protein
MTLKTEFVLSAKDDTQTAFRSATASLGELKLRADGLMASSMAGLGGGLAAGLLGAGFTAQIKSAIDSLDKMDEAAERIGLTTESLSALAYAGKMTGVEFEDMTGALTKLSVKMSDAASGDKAATALFKDLGINVKDASGQLKTADTVFSEVADRFAQFEDGAAKTGLAVDLLGKSGARLVPTLNQGAAGLEAMTKEAKALGGIYDGKLAKQAADFNDNLDKLAILSASAGKSIASDILPVLNKLVEEFLAGTTAAGGFFAALNAGATLNPFKNTSENIKEVRADLAKMEADQKEYGYFDEARFKRKTDQLNYLKKLQQQEALADSAGNYGNEGRGAPAVAGKTQIVRTPSEGGGNEKAPKKAKEVQEASAEATAYGKSMQSLADMTRDADAALLDLSKSQKTIYDLMVSSEWQSMPDTWKQTAIAQAEAAIAGEKAAESAKRLSTMLGETDSSKIEKARDDMLLLVEALEAGKISEEQYVEAASKRLETNTEKLKEQKTVAEELGLTFTSSFENSIASGGKFSDILKGLEQDLIKLLLRLSVTEPAMKAIKDTDWGSLASGLVSRFMGSGTPAPQAKGGVFTSPSLSAYSGGVYNSPTPFRFASGAGIFGEAGPEAIMPLKRGADGKLGVASQGAGNVVVNVINNTDAQAKTEKRSDGRGGSIIDVVIEQVRGAIASDISRGSGPVPAAMQSSYGLNRAAGAY